MILDVSNLAHAPNDGFLQRTLDSLQSHLAVLKKVGTIVTVNAAWSSFASNNGLAAENCGPGANYLHSCDRAAGACSEEAPVVAEGIRDVIANRKEDFYLEYPCHSPVTQRWFSVRITRFEIDNTPKIVVSHDNITQRVLAEIKIQEANRLLERLASTDGLTGIPNRSSFDSTLEHEWKRHDRTQLPLSLAMIDVDCFKLYNDQYGHLAGDDCLRRVAQSIKSNLHRPSDFVSRYGGEEFAVILPNTDSEGAATALKKILKGVRKLKISHPDSEVDRGVVTISIGYVSVTPSQIDAPLDFLNRVDQALYDAKANGRDQLTMLEQTQPVPS